jgi:hypothetical protein
MESQDKNFRATCRNASDNRLINIALDEMQKVEHNENMEEFHSRRVEIASEEMERRGLGAEFIAGSDEDFDFEHVA